MSVLSAPAEELPAPVAALVTRIVDDIRVRGLTPGDRYLTSEQAQRTFRVQKQTLNKAMRYLADQQILARQRKAGTFIGCAFEADYLRDASGLSNVHVLMNMEWNRTRQIPAELFVDSLNTVLPGASVAMRYVASNNAMASIVQTIDQIKASKQKEGLLLIFSSRAVQQFAQDSGLPVVNFGSVYPGIDRLPFVEVDQYQVGRVMARHVIAHQHERFLFLTRNEWRRGDNLTLDGIMREFKEANVNGDRLSVRSVAPDEAQLMAELDEVLSHAEYPTGFMCRTTFYADAVLAVAKGKGLEVGRDIDVVSLARDDDKSISAYPLVRPSMPLKDQLLLAAKMLAAQTVGRRPDPSQVIVPVELTGI